MTEAGREVFDAFPEWVRITFYVLSAAASVLLVVGFWLRTRQYLAARKDGRRKGLLRRIARGIREMTPFGPVWRRNPYSSVAHFLTLSGFVVLFLGTVILTIDEDVTGLFLGFHFLRGTSYLAYSLVLDVFGVLFLAGVLMLVGRRAAARWGRKFERLRYAETVSTDPPSFGRLIADDRLFLFLLLLAALAGFLTEGLRIYVDGTTFEQEWSPVGLLLAFAFGGVGMSPPTAFDLYLASWWIHAVGALAFVAYIPYSKAFHMLAGFGSIVFSDERAGKRLEVPISTEPTGFRHPSDFTRAQILHIQGCVRCGLCDDVCPAKASGLPLAPRGVLMDLKQHIALLGGGTPRPVVGNAIEPGALWSCTTCMACMDACALRIEHIPLIVDMRRYLVAQGQLDANLQEALTSLSRYGNSFRKPAKARAKWAQKANPPLKDARKEAVEYLWFVGDYGSYDPRLQEISLRVAEVFSRIGLDYGILYDAERNSGNDVRRVGEEGVFQSLRDANVEALKGCTYNNLITTDPHTYNTLKNEYPPANGGRVLHYAELLDEMIQAGRLRFSRKLGYRVTYHDPCYLGRYNGVYDAPRRVLSALGVELVEMPRNRCKSFCCGAGGGRIWMEETPGPRERPAEMRVKEAATLPGVRTLAVACPKDFVMFTDAVKAAGLEGSLQVRDLIELVEEAL